MDQPHLNNSSYVTSILLLVYINVVTYHRSRERDRETKMRKSISEVGLEDFVKAGLTIEEAKEFHRVLKEAVFGAKGSDPREVWRSLVGQRVLKPWHPHALHQLVYYSVYANWDSLTNGPPLYWFPSLYGFALCLWFLSLSSTPL